MIWHRKPFFYTLILYRTMLYQFLILNPNLPIEVVDWYEKNIVKLKKSFCAHNILSIQAIFYQIIFFEFVFQGGNHCWRFIIWYHGCWYDKCPTSNHNSLPLNWMLVLYRFLHVNKFMNIFTSLILNPLNSIRKKVSD